MRSRLNVDSGKGLVGSSNVGSWRFDIGNVFLNRHSMAGRCWRRNSSMEVEMWGGFVTHGAHRLGKASGKRHLTASVLVLRIQGEITDGLHSIRRDYIQ